jgi:cardiolipin synthase
MCHACRQIEPEELPAVSAWQTARTFLVYHLIRRYPGWAAWLPRHVPRLHPALADRLRPAYEQGKE